MFNRAKTMRRGEIGDALPDAIRKHFPEDVADILIRNDLDPVAYDIQNMFEPANAREVDETIEAVVEHIPDRELDRLVDGDHRDPVAWLRTYIN